MARKSRLMATVVVVLAAVVLGGGAGLWMRALQHPPATAPDAHQAPAALERALSPPDAPPDPAGSDGGNEHPEQDSPPSAQRLPPPLSRRQVLPQPAELPGFADISDLVTPAVVTVSMQKSVREQEFQFFHRFFGRGAPRIEGHGSGFLITPDGTILTNHHVVGDADKLTVTLMDGRKFPAQLVGRDEKTDIAVIRIEASGLPFVKLGDSDRLRVGEWVLAIGSPFREELGHTVTAGIISAKGRGDVGLTDYEDFLQTDAAINPGNSGGPLIDLSGEVVGINTAIATHSGGFQGVSFAIPINFAHSIVQRLLAEGKVTRAWLGVFLEDVSAERAQQLGLPHPEGAEIREVNEGSPAERAGLRPGDVILAMDGRPIEGVASLRNRVSLSRPGQRVGFEVRRGTEKRNVSVELGVLSDQVLADARQKLSRTARDERIGVELSDVTRDLQRRFDLEPDVAGVLVLEVAPDSPAEAAGMQPGDVILSLNREPIESTRDFETALRRVPEDRPLVFRVRRGSQSILITLERTS
jgi:serine protease Do